MVAETPWMLLLHSKIFIENIRSQATVLLSSTPRLHCTAFKTKLVIAAVLDAFKSTREFQYWFYANSDARVFFILNYFFKFSISSLHQENNWFSLYKQD